MGPKKAAASQMSDKRTEQIRRAQRAYRERKEAHVKGLEEHVAALSAQLAEPPDAAGLLRRVAALELENAALKSQQLENSSAAEKLFAAEQREQLLMQKIFSLEEKLHKLSSQHSLDQSDGFLPTNNLNQQGGIMLSPLQQQPLQPSFAPHPSFTSTQHQLHPHQQQQQPSITNRVSLSAITSTSTETTLGRHLSNDSPISYRLQPQHPQFSTQTSSSSLISNSSSTPYQHNSQLPQQLHNHRQVSRGSPTNSLSSMSTLSKKPVPEHGEPYYQESSDESGNKIKTAVEMYGEPDIDYAWKALKALQSLQGNKYVDIVFQLLQQQVNCNDRRLLKSMIIKSAAAKYKILNGCSLIERAKAMEIMDQVQLKNKNHINHIYYNSSHMATLAQNSVDGVAIGGGMESSIPPLVKMPPHADAPFKDAVAANCKSLVNSSADVDELCALFWTQTRVSDRVQREAIFFKMIDVFAKLLRDCGSNEDRTNFLLATEIGREINSYHVNQMFNEVQSMQ